MSDVLREPREPQKCTAKCIDGIWTLCGCDYCAELEYEAEEG